MDQEDEMKSAYPFYYTVIAVGLGLIAAGVVIEVLTNSDLRDDVRRGVEESLAVGIVALLVVLAAVTTSRSR